MPARSGVACKMRPMTDREFLDEYLHFSVWQPAYVSKFLFAELEGATGARKSLALQIYLNFEMALEAFCMWYFTLRDWHPGTPLAERFASVHINEKEGGAFSSARALAEVQSLEVSLGEWLHQPSKEALIERGWNKEQAAEREASIDAFHDVFRRALKNRGAADGDLVRAYNKLKHGLLAFQASAIGVDDQDTVVLPTGKIEAIRTDHVAIQCSPDTMEKLVQVTVSSCGWIAGTLALMDWYYLTERSWEDYQAGPNVVAGVAQIWQRVSTR